MVTFDGKRQNLLNSFSVEAIWDELARIKSHKA